jgi:MFS family permease
MSQFQLLRQRRFGPFFCTQFLGAFNDNVFKNAVVILIAFSGLEAARSDLLVNLAAGIFILPYFLFSATAGQLADKFEKAALIRIIKAAEIGIMVLAAVGFVLHSIELLLGVLFLLGTQATMFGPVKYSILPQHLRASELVGGNGLVEMGTFVAILLGTIAGGLLVAMQPLGPLVVAAAVIVFAGLGWLASRAIPHAPADAPELRLGYDPLRETAKLLRYARQDRVVFYAILANSWFWFYGALFLAQFPGYARSVLGANEQVVTLMLTAFSVGIGVGSTMCDSMSSSRIELGLVLLGAVGLTGFAVDLFLASPRGVVEPSTLVGAVEFMRQPRSWRIVADLVLIGVFGGWFIVPLYALMQHRSRPEHRSRVIAANNVLNALFMVAAAVLAIALRAAGVGIAALLLLTGLLNALVAAVLVLAVPEFLVRLLVWLPTRTLVRLRGRDLGRIPEHGGVVLACEQASPLEVLLLSALCPRPCRFVAPPEWLGRPGLGFVLRRQGALAHDPADTALGSAVRALHDGDVVCTLGPSEDLLVGVVEQARVPVLPVVCLGRRGGAPEGHGPAAERAWLELARHLGRRLELVVGAAIDADDFSPAALGEQQQALRARPRV